MTRNKNCGVERGKSSCEVSDLKETAERRCREVLCPFLERACPYGEMLALRCRLRLSTRVEVVDDFLELGLDCDLAQRMFLNNCFTQMP